MGKEEFEIEEENNRNHCQDKRAWRSLAFGVFLLGAVGGIYAWTNFIVYAQIAPVNVKVPESIKRRDAAEQNTNGKIQNFAKHFDKRFDELREDVRSNGKKIDVILLKLSTLQK